MRPQSEDRQGMLQCARPIFDYTPGQTVYRNNWVFDNGWSMVANKTTTDRAAPQRDFNESWDMPDVPVWDTPNPTNTGTVSSGRIWDLIEPISVVGFQVWVPEVGSNVNYAFRWYYHPEGQPELLEYGDIAEPVLVEENWTTLGVSQALLLPGSRIALEIVAINSSASSSPPGTPTTWVREPNSNNQDPGPGGWNRSNNGNIVRIHEQDDNLSTINLSGVIAGSIIKFETVGNPNSYVSYITTSDSSYFGGVYSWDVALDETGSGGEPLAYAQCTTTITVPTPAATAYKQLTGGNPTIPWGTSQGFLIFDDVEQANVENDAFGVRILVDTWTDSPDWEIFGYSPL